MFLGHVSLLKRFVPDFSTIVEPLVLLLRGKVEFCWGESQQKAFTLLKNSLSLAPLLAYPDFDKPFIVQTDASLKALGAVLSQVDKDGIEHPVAYSSQVLNKHERNYTVTKRECLAIIFAVKQFQVYVHGVEFSVVTNHASLKWLQTLKEPEGCLAVGL